MVVANWKTRYMWYINIVYLNGRYTNWKQITLVEKECILERIPPYFVGVLLIENPLYYLEGKLQWMNNASLQAGDRSLLYSILHFRLGMHYVKLILHVAESYVPFKGRLYFFWRYPAFFRTNTFYFARDGGQDYATISMLLGCKHIYICLLLICVWV